jgi:hypothetical protein
MRFQKGQVLLNRSLFTRRTLQATALTTLTTLIHRFPAPGSYELFVRRDGSLIHRAPVQVVDGGVFQININMAGAFDERYVIAPGGALGFFAGSGSAAYAVMVERVTGKDRSVVLESSTGIPAGDLFAVTLVRAGRYRVVDPVNKIDGIVTVDTPQVTTLFERSRKGEPAPKERYRPDQPTLVTIGRGEMKPREVRILAGQSVVFECAVAANLRVEPLDDNPKAGGEKAQTPQRLRRTFPKTGK